MKLIVILMICAGCVLAGANAEAQPGGMVRGVVTDETGGVLPGVTVALRSVAGLLVAETVTSASGEYQFDSVTQARYRLDFTLINFATSSHPEVDVPPGVTRHDAVMHLSLNADVVVLGRRTFSNLADAQAPAENLVGIAQSASQGAITAKQLEVRPFMRQGEVLETVPGVIVTQHSGEGKANQYFLRGFNLDHGSDFAVTVAGAPVNMPTHAHSQGYSDINFLIPELVVGVQFSKGPYYADQGDFATAGASNINYATELDRAIGHVETGSYGYTRGLFAASPRVAGGHLLVAFEASTNSGPWSVPDSYRKLNGVARYSRGNNVNGFSVTAMAYNGEWHATQAAPQRAVTQGLIDRFGTIDPTDQGQTYRASIAGEWQHSTGSVLTKVTAFGIGYDLNLISNFTFFLDDPVHGDQQQQIDHRFASGAKVFQRRNGRWRDHAVQNTYGVQIRNDNIGQVGLFHTVARQRLDTRSDASAVVTSAGLYVQNELEWTPWLKTIAGIRLDGSYYSVADQFIPANSGSASAGIVSPKGAVTLGPWNSTEFYVNAGTGFHSNNALGTTIVRDAQGRPVEPVTPLVRATGAEGGMRTVAVPHLQSTVSVWMLRLNSELVYNGDIGATEPGPASKRYGVEFTNYYSPTKWLVFDGDLSLSRARFADHNPSGPYVPEAVGTVVSGGASVDNFHRAFGSLRLRYFGSRPLVDDNSVRSRPTTLLNLEAGYQLMTQLRVTLQMYNLLDAEVSDIDYYFASRLAGEPLEGVDDIHFHPTVPRSMRVSLVIGF